MITPEGCQQRRQRFLERLRPSGPLLLADPLNLRYLAHANIDPFSLGAEFGGLLRIDPDGRTTLYHDNRFPSSIEQSYVDERVVLPWYDGQSPGRGPRRLQFLPILEQAGTDGRIHDLLTDPLAPRLQTILSELRRTKDADEVETLRACMRAAEAGHAWARQAITPDMTELDVYCGVATNCQQHVGRPVIVYGDFIVSPGPKRRVGLPTRRRLHAGDTFILDFSVVIDGYRCDFTNTLLVGGKPTEAQLRLMNLCVQAMAAGEAELCAGAACQAVYSAIRNVFAGAGVAELFPHHAGHGLGLSHPESPYIVAFADEYLQTGDVITLEPGLYQDGVGGIRIEHNYLITDTGYERLSQHTIALC